MNLFLITLLIGAVYVSTHRPTDNPQPDTPTEAQMDAEEAAIKADFHAGAGFWIEMV